MMEEAVACQQRAIQMDMQDITPINTPQPVIQEQVPSQVPTSPLAYPDKTDTDVRAPLSPFSYPVQSSAPNSRSSFSLAASASHPAQQSLAVDVPEYYSKPILPENSRTHSEQQVCRVNTFLYVRMQMFELRTAIVSSMIFFMFYKFFRPY